MDQNRRPSIYLQERAENLGRVFDFFTAPHRGQSPSAGEMFVVFLSQIDFWEWELDNLIYAYTTFGERSTAWEHENGFGLANVLRTRGIWIKDSAVKNIKVKRQARAERRSGVFAPVESLNAVVARWNDLLRLCEDRVLVPTKEREIAVRSGAHIMADLSRFRKAAIGV